MRTKADIHIDNIAYRKDYTIAAARDDYMGQVRRDIERFNALDSVRAPGELTVEIVDHVVNQRALLRKVMLALEPGRPREPPTSDLYDTIDETRFLEKIGLLN